MENFSLDDSEFHQLADRAVNAAYQLLLRVEDFDRGCSLFNPDGGLQSPETEAAWKKAEAVIAQELATRAVNILSELRSLHDILKVPEVWNKLAMANAMPASIGNCHGPSYAEAAFRLGDKRYADIYFMVNYQFKLDGLSMAEIPVITAENIIDRKTGGSVAGFVRGSLVTAPTFDISLAREHLAKEAFRATGELPTGLNPPDETRFVSPNDARDAWMYEQKASGKTHGEIIASLAKDHSDWEQLEIERSVGKAIERFAERTKKPSLRRKR